MTDILQNYVKALRKKVKPSLAKKSKMIELNKSKREADFFKETCFFCQEVDDPGSPEVTFLYYV